MTTPDHDAARADEPQRPFMSDVEDATLVLGEYSCGVLPDVLPQLDAWADWADRKIDTLLDEVETLRAQVATLQRDILTLTTDRDQHRAATDIIPRTVQALTGGTQ